MAQTNNKHAKKPAPMKRPGPPQRQVVQVGRNEACPCGSGKKYKHCHESEGQTYLAKLAHQERRKETMQRLKEEGVPWYRRLFAAP
jgi:hypothetical protein